MTGRVLLGLAVLAAWGSLGRVLRVRGVPHPRGLTALVDLAFLTQPAVAGVATLAVVVAVALFVFDRHARAAATFIVIAFSLGGHVQASQWPGLNGVNGAIALPGAALAAWVVAQHVAGTPEERARRGHEAACGIVAAFYPLLALSKVLGSGLAWAGGGNIGRHVAVHAVGGLAVLEPLRLGLAASPALCTALGVGTLVIEGGAIAFLWPAARPAVAVAVAAMHVGIGLFMGLHHYECLLVVAGLAVSRR
ncbi:MAG: hypothetical protein ACOZNI_36570 [Myxococcota bacterium]